MFKFHFDCLLLLTLCVVSNSGDYGLNRGSNDHGNNNEMKSNHLNHQQLTGRYVSNVGSYRLTPDDVAVKTYRNLYYKNHQPVNRINSNVLNPLNSNNVNFMKGMNNRLRNGANNLINSAPSSSVTKMITSASTLTTSTLFSSASPATPTISTTSPPEKPVLESISDSLAPIEGRSTLDSTIKSTKSRPKVQIPKLPSTESFQDLMSNMTIHPNGNKIIQDIYRDNVFDNQERQEQVKQMSKWMSSSPSSEIRSGPKYSLTNRNQNQHQLNDSLPIERITIVPKSTNHSSDHGNSHNGKRGKGESNQQNQHSHNTINKPEALVLSPSPSSSSSSSPSPSPVAAASTSSKPASSENNLSTSEDDEAALLDDEEGSASNAEAAGTLKTPPCGKNGRHYCIFREDYPIKVVTEVTRYYKWPLEKLFRDLRNQVMPKLANDNYGGLVCDSITRVVRPGWARNTNNRWLVVINTDSYQQYVTEVLCRHGSGSYCNFIPPCYHATCRQRYNTQKLLVIDPWNPYKGPFLSEFLFPSCCICHVSDESLTSPRKTVTVRPDGRSKLDDPHRSGMTSESSTEKIEL